jgi:hypothetical protein
MLHPRMKYKLEMELVKTSSKYIEPTTTNVPKKSISTESHDHVVKRS